MILRILRNLSNEQNYGEKRMYLRVHCRIKKKKKTQTRQIHETEKKSTKNKRAHRKITLL